MATFGWITIVYWLSRAVFPQPLPPLAPLPSVEGVLAEISPWIREQSPALNRPDAELVADVRREALRAFAFYWFVIGAGVASGVLMVLRRRAGRTLAIVLCAAMLVREAVTQALLASDHALSDYWIGMVHGAPRYAISTAIEVLFMAATLTYLTRRRVGTVFDAVERAPAPR